jgi:hypothetical protein
MIQVDKTLVLAVSFLNEFDRSLKPGRCIVGRPP